MWKTVHIFHMHLPSVSVSVHYYASNLPILYTSLPLNLKHVCFESFSSVGWSYLVFCDFHFSQACCRICKGANLQIKKNCVLARVSLRR